MPTAHFWIAAICLTQFLPMIADKVDYEMKFQAAQTNQLSLLIWIIETF